MIFWVLTFVVHPEIMFWVLTFVVHSEIMRVSSIVHNHGFGDFDRHRFRSPSPMSSPNPRANLPGNGFSPWSGLQEVTLHNIFAIKWVTLLYFIHKWMCFFLWESWPLSLIKMNHIGLLCFGQDYIITPCRIFGAQIMSNTIHRLWFAEKEHWADHLWASQHSAWRIMASFVNWQIWLLLATIEMKVRIILLAVYLQLC